MKTIKRASSSYRPYIVDGKYIGRIIFHDGNKELCTTHSGFIEYQEFDPIQQKKPSASYDLVEFKVYALRNARTINLSKKDNFVIKYKDKEKGYYEEGYVLYLYSPDFKYERRFMVEYDLQNKWFDIASFTLHNAYIKNYVKLDNGKFEYIDTPVEKIYIKTNIDYEPNEKGKILGKLKDELNDILKNNHIRFDSYDVEKLLNNFNITKKGLNNVR